MGVLVLDSDMVLMVLFVYPVGGCDGRADTLSIIALDRHQYQHHEPPCPVIVVRILWNNQKYVWSLKQYHSLNQIRSKHV
jgi:hypothetical protein